MESMIPLTRSFPECLLNGIIDYRAFCVCLFFSLTMLLKFIYVFACISSLFPLLLLNNIPLYSCITICLFFKKKDGHLSCFQLEGIINEASLKSHIQIFVLKNVSFLLGKYLVRSRMSTLYKYIFNFI